MPLPPAHVLAGFGAAELVRGVVRLPLWPAWLVAAGFALLPDIDVVLRAATGQWGHVDRSFTHSLPALAVVGLVVWIVAGRRWSALAAAAYGSHLVLDLLQTQARTSVALFWPLQERGMAPLAPLFPSVPHERGAGMRQAALSLLEPETFRMLAIETGIAAVLFLGCLALGAALRRWCPPGPAARET